MKTIDVAQSKLGGIREIFTKILFIVIGNLLCSLAFNLFFVPNGLLSGGVGGVAIMTQYLTEMPAGISVFLINLPIFVVGVRMIDKKFITYAFISMLVFSSWLTITKDISKYFIVEDILLGSVFGAVLNGLGMGLMFRNGTCQGGLDVIAAILKRKLNVNIGTGLMMVNTVIITLSSLLFGYKAAMYTLISMYIGYQILDKVQTGFNVQKNVVIVSEKSKELSTAIIEQLHRGVTFLKGQGGYTHEDKNIIYCILTSREIAKLKEIVNEVDPKAFFTITDVVEVKGKGFKSTEI
ncbi:YitT family protein [Tissierella carlieri]|uniref:YitT family protein n=1 Tax=Tissierella carlieri TaxID=689904 RepID=A0ABT1S8G0_9FIRM|nr:YitT family protein [Tissierella carlieri]MBU5312755.1 YitT family protein [Tissierella carlieri]MCQ4922754.1 YitT family protein [Tissierella carlieri]MDU5082300.1 YitT family protein [Bacillota bacterium]